MLSEKEIQEKMAEIEADKEFNEFIDNLTEEELEKLIADGKLESLRKENEKEELTDEDLENVTGGGLFRWIVRSYKAIKNRNPKYLIPIYGDIMGARDTIKTGKKIVKNIIKK